MRPITLQQIAELPEKKQRQFKACCNEYLGQQYAAQQRRKKIMSERTKIELGIESEVKDEHSTD